MSNNQNPLKIVFFGTPRFVVPLMTKLADLGWLYAVVTAQDQKVGRRQTITPSEVKQAALNLGLSNKKILTPEKFGDGVVEELQIFSPDLFLVAAYGKIIPQNVLKIPKYGALNIHPSRLPKYRGASPIQSQIFHGETDSGITIIQMDEQMDHGPVVCTKDFTLSQEDTFESLSNKMFLSVCDELSTVISGFIIGKITPIPQDHSQATFTKLITRQDGFFDITTPPDLPTLDRMIRAYYPWPNTWTIWNGKIVKFLPANMVQMEGKQPTLLSDFLHGYPNFPIKHNE